VALQLEGGFSGDYRNPLLLAHFAGLKTLFKTMVILASQYQVCSSTKCVGEAARDLYGHLQTNSIGSRWSH
jgi:hypothetical protein